MNQIVILSGSPSSASRTEAVLRELGRLLGDRGFHVVHFSVSDFNPVTLCRGHYDSKEIQTLTHRLKEAAGVVIGSPVYKASYSGVLKGLLDLLPEDTLEGKPVLPIMTGGSGKHLLAIEYALKPLLAELKGEPLQGVYLLDKQIDRTSLPVIHDAVLLERIHKQLEQFIQKTGEQKLAVSQKRQ
ncbi:FMN reductase (NADPH) [Sporolactobacillus sp. THM7-7]|nr:FMN reductase (NADPH) [Sporolactobacillus sp. THM7-7]